MNVHEKKAIGRPALAPNVPANHGGRGVMGRSQTLGIPSLPPRFLRTYGARANLSPAKTTGGPYG